MSATVIVKGKTLKRLEQTVNFTTLKAQGIVNIFCADKKIPTAKILRAEGISARGLYINRTIRLNWRSGLNWDVLSHELAHHYVNMKELDDISDHGYTFQNTKKLIVNWFAGKGYFIYIS